MNINTITYNKQFIETSGSDLVLNVDSFNEFEILLKNNITLSLSNINGNKKITIWLIQDGTGSRTITFSNQFTFTDVNVNTITSTANATTVQKFDINSGKVYCSYTSNATGGSSGGTWGSITGTLSDQTDLQDAFNHLNSNSATITPLDDRQALTIRRNSAGQTNHILDVQTEANGQLAYIDKDGNLSATNIEVGSDLTLTTGSNTIDLTNNITGKQYALYDMASGALTLTAAANPKTGGFAWGIIRADGSTLPDVSAFTLFSGIYDNTNDIDNHFLIIRKNGVNYIYWSKSDN